MHWLSRTKRSVKHHGRYGGDTGRNTAKTIAQEALTAKPEAEIWWQPVF